mmetsp:Transcript_13334/g.20829  ORF Transcript_13334/g.20829 Transcript_13334/m.20829 type:complete len:234 (-) Transcript_13334:416-1117(-)
MPFVLLEVVLHFAKYAQLIIDYLQWPTWIRIYTIDYFIRQHLNKQLKQEESDDVNEDELLDKAIHFAEARLRAINSTPSDNFSRPLIQENLPEEGVEDDYNPDRAANSQSLGQLDQFELEDVRQLKEDLTSRETMHPDFFSGTFYAMQEKFKKKYGLLAATQSDYYFESLFIITVQVMFCFAIILYGDISIKFPNDYSLNLCLFFTSLVLHFSILATIRNGISMCKFAVYHHD